MKPHNSAIATGSFAENKSIKEIFAATDSNTNNNTNSERQCEPNAFDNIEV